MANALLNHLPPRSAKAKRWKHPHRSCAWFRKRKRPKLELDGAAQKKNAVASGSPTVSFLLGQHSRHHHVSRQRRPLCVFQGETRLPGVPSTRKRSQEVMLRRAGGANFRVGQGSGKTTSGWAKGRESCVNAQAEVPTLSSEGNFPFKIVSAPRILMWAYSCPWQPPHRDLA